MQLRDELAQKGPDETVVVQGTVKRVLRHQRGYVYGFITPDDGGADVYFREGYVGVSGLVEGVRVEVEVEQAPQGRRARGVRVMG